ncbi:MFS transporter [uncultured Limosilactobacillus sp.]|uniref:MDR family MFS transporter n=1 Tax=uncultured Limosilactobacillus sp. TaxID=2837629 RepID=UPI0025E3C6AB|nr:MFS transporter [uncultured Limosilactobacillus sp.]
MKNELKLRWLLLGTFLASVGNSFVWPLTTVYVHTQLHQSLTMSGIVLLFYSGTNVVGSYIGGRLFDKHDPQKLTMFSVIAEIVMMGLLMWQNGWPAYPLLLPLVGFLNGWLMTMLNSYGTRIHAHDGRFVFNMLYFANNFGMMIGTAVVGPMYQATHNQVAPLFAVTGVMYLFFLFVVWRCYRTKFAGPKRQKLHKAKGEKLPSPNLAIIWTFFIGIAIIWVVYNQWSSNMSVYMTGKGISLSLYSLLWTINGLLIVTFQLALSWLNRIFRNPYHLVYFGLLTFALSFSILLFARTYFWFVVAMVVLTLGEATAFPTIPSIINELTPLAEKGKYQGLFNGWSSAGKAVGPLFGGLVIGAASYRILFIVCLVLAMAVEVAVVFISHATRKKTTRF